MRREARGAWRVARGGWRVARGAWRVARGAYLHDVVGQSAVHAARLQVLVELVLHRAPGPFRPTTPTEIRTVHA